MKNNTFELADGTIIDSEDLKNLQRLQKELAIKENLFMSIDECCNIWATHSDSVQASWLFFPENDEDILREIKCSVYFTTFEEYAR